MSALEIAGSVAFVVMAAAMVMMMRRGRAANSETELVELWRVAFNASPIAMLIRQNGVYVHCNDACVQILGARDKAEVLKVGPRARAPERQPDGRLTTDVFKDCDAALKPGKAF